MNSIKIKQIILATFFLTLMIRLNAQIPIELADNTLKIGSLGEEVFYYGFAEGDKVIFSFEEIKGKELKEVEIIEMPGTSKFMDFKTSKIDKKEIIIANTGIYKFRFNNSSVSGRICKFHVSRIPGSVETQNFNSTVYTRTDYDTSYYTAYEKYLVRKDTVIHNITDQVAKVHSVGNLNGNKTTFNFKLPQNTVSWSYYVGVDQEGQDAFQKATEELATKAAPTLSQIQDMVH